MASAGASESAVSEGIAGELGALAPIEGSCELRAAGEEGGLRVAGRCVVDAAFQGAKVPVVPYLESEDLGGREHHRRWT